MKPVMRSNAIAGLLTLFGMSQMLGVLTGSQTLRGIGAASMISPCPKVFCIAPVHGEEGGSVETFSSQFSLVYTLAGEEHRILLKPQPGHLLRGPYNRRNVYGAGLSYAACLPRELVDQILHYGLGTKGSLRAELGVPAEACDLTLVVVSDSHRPQTRWQFPISD
ncbi:MAG: hypothetical protein ACI9R3_000519 [Verrucomicrobiales bacterium]|jgi:hypothetical protein